MKKIKNVVIPVFIICMLFLFRNEFAGEPIIKEAVQWWDIKGDYIICTYEPVTGFDWYIMNSSDGIRSSVYCNIIGPTP